MFWIIVGALCFFFFIVPLLLWVFGWTSVGFFWIFRQKEFWGILACIVVVVVILSISNSGKSQNTSSPKNQPQQSNSSIIGQQIQQISDEAAKGQPVIIPKIPTNNQNNFTPHTKNLASRYIATATVNGSDQNLTIMRTAKDLDTNVQYVSPNDLDYYALASITTNNNGTHTLNLTTCNPGYKLLSATSPTGNPLYTDSQTGDYYIPIIPTQENEIAVSCQKQ